MKWTLILAFLLGGCALKDQRFEGLEIRVATLEKRVKKIKHKVKMMDDYDPVAPAVSPRPRAKFIPQPKRK